MKTQMTSSPFPSAKFAIGAGCAGSRQRQRAFTLIELLVVIAIIAILASMLMPVIIIAMRDAKETQAKLEVNQIATAITQYESQYSRFPVSTPVQQSGSNCVTYGCIAYNNSANPSVQWPLSSWSASPLNPQWLVSPVGIYVTNNSEVISILMDFTNFPSNPTVVTTNLNYQKNPMQTIFLSAKTVGDTVSPGVGADLNYRDPWGNLYLITIDLNQDNKCEDPYYYSTTVSTNGLNGLALQSDGNYAYHGNVMVWSMGPNGPYNHSPSTFDITKSATDPNNKHHIMSWAQ
jgi:prepilin-type N-terminal cleavage/methylation domain-containing protein